MRKSYKSVQEIVRGVSDDPSFKIQAEKAITERSLSRVLLVLRNARGLTQMEMAERLGCTLGRISKLETASVDSIRVGDLVDYARQLNLRLSISFEPRGTVAQKRRGREESFLNVEIPDFIEKASGISG